jgi:hypothetical protein
LFFFQALLLQRIFYFFVPDSAGAVGTDDPAGFPGNVDDGTGTDDGTSGDVCMTLPAACGSRFFVAINDNVRVAIKKIAAKTAVSRLKKFADPLEPKTLPAEPEPKAAPISAPFPCCNNTKTMMAIAQIT